MKLKFRLEARQDTALKRAPAVLERNLRKGMETIGKRLKRSAQTRMRRDLGDSQKSLVTRIEGTGLNLRLIVFSTLIQAFVDAYGLRRGVFPAFGVNSRLYKWALRKARGSESKVIREKNLGKTPGPKKVKKLSGRVRSVRRAKHQQAQRRLNAGQRAKAKNTDARRMAFMAAKKIYYNGIRPTYWNRKALEANKHRITRDMQNAISRAVREITKG